MEWHNVSATGQIDLINRMEVKKFLKVNEITWVPAEASMIDIFNGREWTGYSMKLDEKRSSFNSIKSDELFLAKSLPHMNYEKNGWKWDYPTDILLGVRASDAAINGGHTKVTTRIVLGAMVVISLGLLLSIIVLMAHRKGHRPNM
jgi:hypothetical protein